MTHVIIPENPSAIANYQPIQAVLVTNKSPTEAGHAEFGTLKAMSFQVRAMVAVSHLPCFELGSCHPAFCQTCANLLALFLCQIDWPWFWNLKFGYIFETTFPSTGQRNAFEAERCKASPSCHMQRANLLLLTASYLLRISQEFSWDVHPANCKSQGPRLYQLLTIAGFLV